jgi:hypothetical protein
VLDGQESESDTDYPYPHEHLHVNATPVSYPGDEPFPGAPGVGAPDGRGRQT